MGRLGSQIQALCLTAICADRLGESGNAMLALNKALELGFHDGYVRTFVDLRQPMADLLAKYKSWVKETGNDKYLAYSRKLLKQTKEDIKIFKAATLVDNNKKPNVEKVKKLLSERELTVLNLMAEGLSNQQIAERLFITIRTVKYYNARIFDKLGVNSRLEAIIKARELGI